MVHSVDDAREELLRNDSLVLVERGIARSVWLRCPCGCGSQLRINVDERIDPSWHLIRTDGKLTLIPSIWREVDCGAHFILWRSEIVMCGTARIPFGGLLRTEKAIKEFLKL